MIPSLIAAVVVLLSMSTVLAADSKKVKAVAAPSCAVSGELRHWEIDHCLLKLETDDFTGNHAAVEKCMKELSASKDYPKDDCARKIFLKTEYCNFRIKYQKDLNLKQCIKSDKYNSPTVVNGGADS